MKHHLKYAAVDERIRALIVDLNTAGWETCSSCQGRTCQSDYERDRHTEHAFITFSNDIPAPLRRKAQRCGLVVWNGNITVSPVYEDDRRRHRTIRARQTYMKRNREFPAAVRTLFLEDA